MLREDEGKIPPEQRKEFIERSYQKSEKLVQIIADVLSATEMDVPDFNIAGTARPLDLGEIAQKAVNSSQKEAEDKGISLSAHIHKVPQVESSEVYLPQATNNLIDNAIKYTKKGTVIVEVYSDSDFVFFSVKDTGAGVPKDDLNTLWTKFKRAKNARDMHTDGSGLGLFIVKKIVEGHPGGEVFVKSELGKGSTFGFKLPIMKERK
jgi:two-component system phosphate regulon sensor histidine kinase PhoR